MRNPVREQLLRGAAVFVIVAAVVHVYRHILRVNPTTVALSFLLTVLLISAVWRLWISVFASVLCTLAFNYYFLPPIGTFTIADPQNWVALGAFLITAMVASHLSEQARRRTQDADRRRREVERLYTFTQQLLVTGNVAEVLNAIPRRIVEAFQAHDAALFLASKDEIYRFGPDPHDLDSERLKTVMTRGEPILDTAHFLCFTPVMLGVRPVGSVGILGATIARETLEAVGSLIAIAIERASAVEALSKAEAARQHENLRTALLDAVTHELRTPLTSIKAAVTGLLSQPQLTEAQRRELTSVIDEESDRLNRLIEQALEMARLDAGEIRLQMEPRAIREPIQAAMKECQDILADHTVEVNLPPDLPAVRFDFARIQQVVVNLLDNAAKYSPSGTKIRITSEVAGNSLVTSVADRGTGIDGLEQELIFNKFYRGKDQRYRVQGTGMGLAICKAILEAHGGTIGVTSQPGRGSVFQFGLPLSAGGIHVSLDPVGR